MSAVDHAFMFAPPPREYEIVAFLTVDDVSDPFTASIMVIVQEPQAIEPEASSAATPIV